MKLLYVASDQKVPGRTGGSVHVEEVARGLSARGHEVHVVARAGDEFTNEFTIHPNPAVIQHRFFRWTARRKVDLIIEELGVDAVMERYYNFGGEGVRAAFDRNLPVLVEVNAPLREHPGSAKTKLDKLLLFHPMARLRDEICRKASAVVTPLPSILPENLPPEKIHQVNWGANVEMFQPDTPRAVLPIPEDCPIIVFSGSFRPWHGADVLVRASVHVPEACFLFVGDGPSNSACRNLARKLGVEKRVFFTGAVPYRQMPSYLKWASIGVAPYQPSRLGQMKLGFFWSPLKIFEYMAMGLPVVTLDVDPLREIVGEQGGRLVSEGNPEKLAAAIQVLLTNSDLASAMGRAARERVVREYSWQQHCQLLERILLEMTAR